MSTIKWFQKEAFKQHVRLGYAAETAILIFGVIIHVKNILEFARFKEKPAVLFYTGEALWCIANFCSLNNIDFHNVMTLYNYEKVTAKNEFMEDHLEKLKEDLEMKSEMSELQKIELVNQLLSIVYPHDINDAEFSLEEILLKTIEKKTK